MIDIFRETPDVENSVITIKGDSKSIFESIQIEESESNDEKRDLAENDRG